MVSRRELVTKLSAFTALIACANYGRAFATSSASVVSDWLTKTNELSAMLRGETITISEWRTGLEQFNDNINLPDLLNGLNFDQLKASAGFAERGVATAKIDFGDRDIRTLTFYPKVFAVNTGRAIIPHGHSNMVSAHLVASGQFHLRQYDQISRDDISMLVRPSVDKVIQSGDLSSIGEVHDNVHWFIALEPSYTIDVIVTGLDPAASSEFDIFNLDMDAAVKEGEGLRVPRMSVGAALEKYG